MKNGCFSRMMAAGGAMALIPFGLTHADSGKASDAGHFAPRERMETAGMAFELIQVTDFLVNFRGGESTGGALFGLVALEVELDGERLVGWRNVSGNLSLLQPYGPLFSGRKIGALEAVSNIEADNSVRLYEAFLQWEDPGAGHFFQTGLMASDELFATIETAEIFLNGSLGAMPTLGENTGGPIWPVGGWGAAGQAAFPRGHLRAARGEEVTRSESAGELTWAAEITTWLTLQPNLQYVMNPHESRNDAWVAGMRAAFLF